MSAVCNRMLQCHVKLALSVSCCILGIDAMHVSKLNLPIITKLRIPVNQSSANVVYNREETVLSKVPATSHLSLATGVLDWLHIRSG